MSSLGFHTVLHGFAALPGVLAERVFLDEGGAALRVLDAGFAPAEADLLAFSVSGENDYENLLRVLELAGLPLRAADRREGHPVVVAGGFAPTLNPEPIAPFVDAVAVGEGEELLAPLLDALRDGGGRRAARAGLARRLVALPGVYVPALYEPGYDAAGRLASFSPAPDAPGTVRRAAVRDLDAWPAFVRTVAPGSEFEDLCLVEVNRGCGRGCRFCAAGNVVRPLRHRSLARLEETIAEGSTLFSRFGLLGAAVADHPALTELARGIVARGWGFSLSSLRLDNLQPELLELLRQSGARTATLAPETGSERLRHVVNKRISDERVLDAAGQVAAAGIRHLKLYFMVGLPTEGAEDRAAIAELVRRIRHRTLAARRVKQELVRISVTLSCFVPKAWTPFQWHPFAGVRELKTALAGIVRELRKVPNTEVTHDLPKWAFVQALLSLGDRRVAEILEASHRLGGDWKAAFAGSALNPDFVVRRGREREELLPWDFIDTGIAKDALWRQYRTALAGGAAGETADSREADA
jgi:radical SAM superfamily enzyme YgiQ (UPF0313 family)